MKKLMVLAAAAMCAVAANAAKCNWTMSAVAPTEHESTAANYTFVLLDAANYASIDAAVTALMNGGLSTAGIMLSGQGTGVASDPPTVKIQKTNATLPTGYNNDDYVKVYSIVFDGSIGENATAENYMFIDKTSEDDKSPNYMLKISSAGLLNAQFGSQASNTWNSIPEPTSGLLLLLGVAGLALRRRRA